MFSAVAKPHRALERRLRSRRPWSLAARNKISLPPIEGLATQIDVASLIANQTPGRTDPRRFATETLGSLLSADTQDAISRAETKAQAVSIAFLSPEFQRR